MKIFTEVFKKMTLTKFNNICNKIIFECTKNVIKESLGYSNKDDICAYLVYTVLDEKMDVKDVPYEITNYADAAEYDNKWYEGSDDPDSEYYEYSEHYTTICQDVDDLIKTSEYDPATHTLTIKSEYFNELLNTYDFIEESVDDIKDYFIEAAENIDIIINFN